MDPWEEAPESGSSSSSCRRDSLQTENSQSQTGMKEKEKKKALVVFLLVAFVPKQHK